MRCVFGLVLLFLSILHAMAAPLPLTTKDVSLMLRSGDSSARVMQDLSKRHFVGTFDAASETALIKAGASADLIAALKSGAYSLSPEQSAAAQQQIVDQAKRRAAEAERARKFDTLYQAQLAREHAAAAAPNPGGEAISSFLNGALVRSQNGSLVQVEPEALAKKKLIAFYFSAHWCGPCRKFTPQLVEYYNRIAPQHPEFEIVFFSADHSASAMADYMRETNMPWPAIDYQKLAEKEVLKKNAGNGIPSLVLVDATGKVLSSASVDGKYLGPQKVLADLDAIFASGAGKQLAGNL